MSRLHPDSLFGRAFILITALLLVSLLAWSAIYQYAQREPLANEIAQQAVSVVNLTRAAILHADPQQRIELLHDMNDSEQLRVYLARPDEHIQPVAPEPLTERIAQQVRHALGPETRIGFARDGVEGFWVSFFIGDDEFSDHLFKVIQEQHIQVELKVLPRVSVYGKDERRLAKELQAMMTAALEE